MEMGRGIYSLMSIQHPIKSSKLVAAFSLLLIISVQSAAVVAQEPDTERRFWPPNSRPPATTQPASKQTTRPRYHTVSAALPHEAAVPNDSVLGVTIWLLSDRMEDKDGARILVPKTGKKTQYTAKRLEASTKFREGQKLRLSIEVPRSGYLYVIDREQYADGSFADPKLIFPVHPAENNRALKGRVFNIPSAGEEPYFVVESSREADKSPLVTDLLTLLVTPTPLKGLPKSIRNSDGEFDPIPLPLARVEEWEKQWAAEVEVGELEGGAGQLYSVREQAAGTRRQRLTQADPLPQTVFRIAAQRSKPLLVKLPLQIAAK